MPSHLVSSSRAHVARSPAFWLGLAIALGGCSGESTAGPAVAGAAGFVGSGGASGGAGSAGAGTASGGAAGSPATGGSGGIGGAGGCTPGCPSGSVCSGGTCQTLPRNCPCPVGSYCDLSTNTCKAGCAEDNDCAQGEYCDVAARQCKAGCRWSTESLPENGYAVWGSSSSDVYVAGANGTIFHSKGDGRWSLQYQMPDQRPDLHAIWGSGAGDVYVVGDLGTILHSTGNGTWTPQGGTGQSDSHYRGIWGSGPSDIYIAGDQDTTYQVLLHSKGDGWWSDQIQGSYPFGNLSAVWGSGPQDIYAVGTTGWSGSSGGSSGGPLLLHSTGDGTWSEVENPVRVAGGFASIWLGGPNDVYVIGGPNVRTSYHVTSDGQWTPITTSSGDDLTVWGTSKSDVYLLNSQALYHSTGNGSWTSTKLPGYVTALWGSGGCNLYLLGEKTIFHRH